LNTFSAGQAGLSWSSWF